MAGLKEGTMIVVADSEKALFLVNLTDADDPNFELIRKTEEANPPDREQSANRPGRDQASHGSRISSYDNTDFHELQKERFAADLAERLYKMAHAGKFERLVLVASPQVLGNLRSEMHKEVSDRIVAEIPKTLTNHPVDEIEKLVKAHMDSAA